MLSAYRYALVPDSSGVSAASSCWSRGGTIPLGAISAGFLLEQFGAVTSMLVLPA